MAAGDFFYMTKPPGKEMWQCKINRLHLFLCVYFLWLVYSAPWWTAFAHDNTGPINAFNMLKKTKGTAHICSLLYSSKFLKFIETDWFLQIIVKLILPLNMKLERGLDVRWVGPNIKTGGSWLAVKMFCDQYYQPKKCLHKST